MRKKVVCFDLDDTLYKEKSFLFSGYRKIAETVEGRTGAIAVLHKMCQLRREGKNVFEVIEQEYNGIITKAEMLTIYREHFPTIKLDDCVEELLDQLKKRSCIIGLITDGRSISQRNKINALGLTKWIDKDNIIISEEFGSEKPDERNYQFFEKSYPGCRYYYIGDNPTKDFVTPNRLGWEPYCIEDLYDVNIHKCDLNDVEDSYRPHGTVNEANELIYKIVPPLVNEYIVPLMEDVTKEETQVGTGVIFSDYLVTAAHVFYNDGYKELKYRFDGMQFGLNLENAVFDGHLKERRDDFSKDLLVFKVNHKGSPLSLNKERINPNSAYESRAYHYEFDKMRTDTLEGLRVICESIDEKNCLLIKTCIGNDFHEGNSGCLIYKDDVIYGSLWRGHKSTNREKGDCRYLFVDSRYITDAILSVE